MYNEKELERVITHLFYQGVGDDMYDEEEIDDLLENISFPDLLQAVRHSAETVYAYRTDQKQECGLVYRGAELFGQRATLLSAEAGGFLSSYFTTSTGLELWLLEDMSLAVVSVFTVDINDGEYVTEYRTYKGNDPWDSDMELQLDALAGELEKMCDGCFEHTFPHYEL